MREPRGQRRLFALLKPHLMGAFDAAMAWRRSHDRAANKYVEFLLAACSIGRGTSVTAMNLALFDFDGTITYSDTWTPFVRTAIAPWRKAVGSVVLAPVMVAYKLKILPGSVARPITARFVFRGQSELDIRSRGARYANEVLPRTIRPNAMKRLLWHKAEGDRVVVVSGGLDVYLRPWCETLGLELICTELEARNGVLTGRYVQGDCTGPRKTQRLVERLDPDAYQVVYAYGDTAEDTELLNLAHRQFYQWQEIAPAGDPSTRKQAPKKKAPKKR